MSRTNSLQNKSMERLEQSRRHESHSRRSSYATTHPNPSSSDQTSPPQIRSSRSPGPNPADLRLTPTYTVVVRLPFKRGEFQDPAAVDWNSAKDKALWKLISRTSNSQDLNWGEIAVGLDVELPFLLRQAAWLYERHFAGMKAQMRKVGTAPNVSGGGTGSGATPTTPITEGGAGEDELFKGSPKIPTSRRDNSLTGGNAAATAELGSSPSTPRSAAPPPTTISRTPSTTTVTQSRVYNPARQRVLRTSSGSSRQHPAPTAPSRLVEDTSTGEDEDEEGDSNDSSSFRNVAATNSKGQSHRRPPSFGRPTPTGRTLSSEADDEEDEDEDDSSGGGYLPFAALSKQKEGAASGREDPAATLRGSSTKHSASTASKRNSAVSTKDMTNRHTIESSASSASSAQQKVVSSSQDQGNQSFRSPRPGPLSPTQKAKLEELTPRSKKSGSEGTPSMGSSFSDLDSESVTRSALEEALMSNMGGASIASRMSSLGGAWKGKKR